MIRRIALAGVAGAVALGGLAAMGGSAYAAKPIITAGAGSSVSCSLTSSAKVSPALKDNWVHADHQSDPNLAVRAIPDTVLATAGPVTVTAKSKSVSCTGTVTNGTDTATVTGVKILLTSDPAHPGSTDPATCAGLVAPDPMNPSTARYNATLSWKASGAKVNPTTITGSSISSAGGNFGVSGGVITGSFAGGSSSTVSAPDGATLNAFLSSTAIQPGLVSSTHTDGGPCQGSLKLKNKKGVDTATLKAGKGIKKIGLASGTLLINR